MLKLLPKGTRYWNMLRLTIAQTFTNSIIHLVKEKMSSWNCQRKRYTLARLTLKCLDITSIGVKNKTQKGKEFLLLLLNKQKGLANGVNQKAKERNNLPWDEDRFLDTKEITQISKSKTDGAELARTKDLSRSDEREA